MADEPDATGPPPPPPELAQAIERFDSGDLEECRALLTQVRETTETAIPLEVPLFEGLCARRGGDLESALTHLREAVELAPQAPHVRHELGLTLIGAGHTQEGLDELREAVNLSDGDAWLRHELYLQNGIALHGEGYLEPAITSLRKALRFSHDIVTHTLLGHLLIEAGQPDQALHCIREGTDHFPNDAELHHVAGLALALKGQPFEAAQAFTRAIELEPRRGDPLHSLGLCFESLGDAARAIDAYERCLRLDCGEDARNDARQRIARLRAGTDRGTLSPE